VLRGQRDGSLWQYFEFSRPGSLHVEFNFRFIRFCPQYVEIMTHSTRILIFWAIVHQFVSFVRPVFTMTEHKRPGEKEMADETFQVAAPNEILIIFSTRLILPTF
jgi:hypothetical protein